MYEPFLFAYLVQGRGRLEPIPAAGQRAVFRPNHHRSTVVFDC